MGLAHVVECDGHLYTVVDDIVLTQRLLIAGRVLDDADGKPVQVALRVSVKPAWLIARFVGEGKFSVAGLGPDASFAAAVNVDVTLAAPGYDSIDVAVSLGVAPVLPLRLDVLLHRQ